ncbi:hypothetical protein HQK30_12730 [Aeromonas hydrophila]|uniref:hypothetical protein n=1 Tax=Aeromonas dhakensis TaxID=196024 RepID=UPI0015985158|nr:hypothetical protein HQK30_12730 [Aeromonas hydrophila]
MKVDFDYINSLLTEFFNQQHIIDQLYIIDEMNISGWEIWIQIELSCFLSKHHSEPEWKREQKLIVDGRKEKDKFHVKPDFLLRKKGWALEKYAALEIKIHPSVSSCIHNIFSDFNKVRKIRRSAIDLRSYWGLGICKETDTSYISDVIKEKAPLANYNISKSISKVANIHNTAYSYILI